MAQGKKALRSVGIPRIEGRRPSFFVSKLECLAPKGLAGLKCLALWLSRKLKFEFVNSTPNSELHIPHYVYCLNSKRATRPAARSKKFICGGGL